MYLKLEVGSKIHNRFEIEVRDARTGEIKQRGQAENIILNRMYERLCNFNSYFNYIHFGKGEGALDTSRNILFDELGYKQAVTEEIIKDFPVSRWVRKIVLNPEEYVGESITEVGISDTYSSSKSSSYINTHALIKDAEGNLLNILKTDTDVVVIYATVFIELQDKSDNIHFLRVNNNSLLDYLLGSSSPSSTIQACTEIAKTISKDVISSNVTNKAATKTVDINNRKVIFTTRYGINEGNIPINAIQLQNTMRVLLPDSKVFTSHSISVNVGVGDGNTSSFILPVSNYKSEKDRYYLDGVECFDFTVRKGIVGSPSLYFDTDSSTMIIDREAKEAIRHFGKTKIDSGLDIRTPLVFKCNYPHEISGIEYTAYQSGRGGDYFPTYYSQDGEVWEEILPKQSIMRDTRTLKFMLPEPIKDVYIKIGPVSYSTDWNYSIPRVWGIRIIPAEPMVLFNTPPPEGAVITADYTVPYIPKTEDYVLDVTCEIQFGEGV